MNTGTIGLNRTPSTALFRGRHTDDASRLTSRNHTPASTPITTSRTFQFEDDQQRRQPATSRAFNEGNSERFRPPENRRLPADSSAQSVSNRLFMLQRFAMTGTMETAQFPTDGEGGEDPSYHHQHYSPKGDRSEHLPFEEACNDSEKDNSGFFTHSSARSNKVAIASAAPVPAPTTVVVRLADLSAELKEAFISELLVEVDDASIAFAKGPASQMIANVSISRGSEKINHNNNNAPHRRIEESNRQGSASTLRVLELVEMAAKQKSEQLAQRMREGRTLLEEAREEITQRRNQQPISSSIPTATGSLMGHIQPQKDHQAVNDAQSSQNATLSTVASGWQHQQEILQHHHRQQHVPLMTSRNASIIEESQRVLLESSAILASSVLADNTSTQHSEREPTRGTAERRAAGTYNNSGHDVHYETQITKPYRHQRRHVEAREQREEEDEGAHVARRPKHSAAAVFFGDEAMPAPTPTPAPSPTPQHAHYMYVSPKRQHYYHPQQSKQEHVNLVLRRDHTSLNNVSPAEEKLGLRVPTAVEKARAAAKEARETYELPASFLVSGGTSKEETSVLEMKGSMSEERQNNRQKQDLSNKKHPLSPSRRRQEETRPVDMSSSSASVRRAADATTRSTKSARHYNETAGGVAKVTSSTTARNPIPLRSRSSSSRPNSRSRTRDPTPTRKPSPRPQAHGEERPPSRVSSARQTATPVHAANEGRRSVSANRRSFAADASTILTTHFNDGTQLSGLKLSAEDQKRHASTATTRTAAWLAKQADEIFTLIHKTVLPPREKLNEILRHEERRWGLRSKQFIVTTDNNDAQSAGNRSRSRDPELRTGGERGRGESKGPTLASCLLYVSPQPPTLFSAIVRHLVSARCGIDSVVSSTIDELAHNAQKFSKVCPTANILHYFFETCRDDDILEQLLLFIAMRHKTLPFASSETQKVTARAVPRSFTREVGDQAEGEVGRIYSLEPLTVAESARYDARRGNVYNSAHSRNQYQQHLIMRRYVPLGKVPAAVKAMLEDLQPQPFSSSRQGNAAGPLLPPPSGNVSINDSVLAAATKETGDPATPSRQRAHSTSVNVSNGTTDHTFVVTSPFRDRQPFLYPSSERNTLTQHIDANGSSSSSAFFMNTTIVSSGQPLQQQQQMAVVPIMISGQSPTRRLRVANNEMSNNTSNHLMNNVVVAEESGYTAACVLKQRVSTIKASIASWISDELQIVEKSQRIAEINRGGAGQGRGGVHHAESEEEKRFIGEDEEEPSIAFDLAGHVDAIELVRAVVAERLNKWSGSDGDATVRGQRKEEEPATVTGATSGKVTYNSAVSELCHPSYSSPSSPLLQSSSSPPPAHHSISKDAILSSLPSSDKRDNVSGVGSDSIFSSRPHQSVSGDNRDHRAEAGKEIQNKNSSQSKEGGGHFVHLGGSSRSVSERRAIENAEAVTRERFFSHSSIPLTNVPHIEERENMNKYKDMFKEGSQQPCLSSPQRKRTERKHSRDQSPTRTWELSGSAAMSIAEERRPQNTARGHSSFVDSRPDLAALSTEHPQRFTQALTAANDVSPPPPALPTGKIDKSSVVEHTNPILADARSMQALRSELRRAQSVLSSEPSSSFYQASGPTQQPKSQRTTLQGDDGPSFPSSTRRPSPVPEGGKEQGSLPKATKQIREDPAENTAIRAKEQHLRQELAKLVHENNLFGAFSASRKNDVDLHVEREGEKGAASLAAGVPSVRRTVSISPHRNVTEYKTTDRPVDLHSQQERGRGPIYADSSSVVSRYNDDDRSPDAKRDFTYSTHNKWHLKAKNTETAGIGSQRSPEAEPQDSAVGHIDHRAHVHVDEDTDKRYNKSTLPTSTDQYSFLDRRFYQRAPLSPSASQPSVGPNEGGRVRSASFSREDENRVPGRREASGERWRSVMRAEVDVNYTSTELSARVGRSQSRMNFDGFAPQYAYERKGSADGVGMMRQPSSPSDRRRSSPSDTYYSNPYEHFASISPYH